MSRPVNVKFLFSQSPKILDLVLSIASDALTVEVQVSSFKVIEEVSLTGSLLEVFHNINMF